MRKHQKAADPARDRKTAQVAAAAEQAIVCNLMQAITRLHDDLDRVELWTAALNSFLAPVPEYKPGDQHLLPGISNRPGGR